MRELKFQVYKAIAGWLLIIASLKIFCSSQKYIFYVAKKKCSDIGNIGYKSTDTDIVILGPISDMPISISVHLYGKTLVVRVLSDQKHSGYAL